MRPDGFGRRWAQQLRMEDGRVSHSSGDPRSFKEIVAEAAVEVGRPTFFSMLIIIIAHIPIFTLQRHEGRIFAPMAYTITSALIGSLIFSLTLVPELPFVIMRSPSAPRARPILLRAHGARRCARQITRPNVL